MSVLDFDHVLRGHVDVFRNTAGDFVSNYLNDAYFKQVAVAIVETLLNYGGLDLEDEQHPFQRFADNDMRSTIRCLRRSVRHLCIHRDGTPTNALNAFFASDGHHRDATEDLLDAYYSMVASIYDDDEDDDDSEDEAVNED